jgi:putative PIN family toxin of toxin-antitoxin system
MRFVLDTNMVISGALWLGLPHHLMNAMRANRFTPCTSREILLELLGVLHRQKFAARLALSGNSARRIVIDYWRLALVVALPAVLPKISRDPKDDVILACAVEAQADAIVSGDKDLLSLVRYQKTPILTATQALNSLP